MYRIYIPLILILILFSAFLSYKYFELIRTNKENNKITRIILKQSLYTLKSANERVYKKIEEEKYRSGNYSKWAPYFSNALKIKALSDSISGDINKYFLSGKGVTVALLNDYIKTVKDSIKAKDMHFFANTMINSDLLANFEYFDDSLTLLKNELIIRTIQYEFEKYMLGHVETWSPYEGNNYIAMVQTFTPVIQLGEEYKSEIFLGNYDTRITPIAKINDEYLKVWDGRARYFVRPTETGRYTYKGILKITRDFGKIEEFPFTSSYLVVPKITNKK